MNTDSAEADLAPPADRPRLYGRRRGRALRAGQRHLLETLLPTLRVALPSAPLRLDPAALFAGGVAGVALEIGFGGGEHLAAQAAASPGRGFIGCEVFEPGIARLLALVERDHQANIRIFPDDARLLVARLAPQTLDQVFILHPDPWPKERHKKRRIVASDTLDALAAAMRPEAELRLATDDADYAAWIEERVDAHPAFARLAFAARPADWPVTRYEAKARRAGREPRLFCYRRQPV